MSLIEGLAGIAERINSLRTGSPEKQMIQLSLGKDGIVSGCTVAGISAERWGSVFSAKVRVHDEVTGHLADRGLLNPASQHIVLSEPITEDGTTKFVVDIQAGPRPNNLYTLYPSPEKAK